MNELIHQFGPCAGRKVCSLKSFWMMSCLSVCLLKQSTKVLVLQVFIEWWPLFLSRREVGLLTIAMGLMDPQ